MTIASELHAKANEIVARKHERALKLDRRLLEIEAEKLTTIAMRDAARDAAQRGLNFRPVLGSDYQCPACFIEDKPGSTLRPIVGEPSYDLFRCETCKEVFRFLSP